MTSSFRVTIKARKPGEVKVPLCCIHTGKFEFALDESERGPSVSYDAFEDEDLDLLESIEFERDAVRNTTWRREYVLDTHGVEREEIKSAAEILQKVNFDRRFLLKVGSA